MKSNEHLCHTLEALWHTKIPLSQAMALNIHSFNGDILQTKAKFLPNSNVMGTAFAGSLYSVQALTGWGMLWLQLQLAGIDKADIVLASADIKYLKPLQRELVTHCDFSAVEGSIATLKETGKSRFKVYCSVIDNEEVVCQFCGDYVVKKTNK